MSFKRDGDDKSLLKNLNDQRVRELLGNHVPQDEAKLLSNGRLTCTICYHRPVFDTISMLANHRRGKRHLHELSKYIKCKEEAERRAFQKKCDLSVDTSASSSQNMSSSKIPTKGQSLLLGYKHATAKQSVFKHQRKPILEVKIASKINLPNPQRKENPEKKAVTTVRHYLKNMTKKTSLEKVVERNRENYGVDLKKVTHESPSHKSSQNEFEPNNFPPPKDETSYKKSDLQEYELKLRMAGWIKDLTGKWIKDPNVEFDSDEDETPPPPPP